MDKDSPNGLRNPAFEQLGSVPDTGVGSDFRIMVWCKGKQNQRQNAYTKKFSRVSRKCDLLVGANWRQGNKIKGKNNVMYNIKIKEILVINQDFKLEGFDKQ